MDVLTPQKIVYFVAFFIPGFVGLKTYDLFYPSQQVEGSKRVIEALAFSCINYAVLSPMLVYMWPHIQSNDKDFFILAVVSFIVLLVSPILLVVVWTKLRTMLAARGYLHHPIGRAWDYTFSGIPKSWVKIYLKDGSVIGGLYGKRSFASSSPEPQEIFLEEAWKFNSAGGFENMMTRSTGLLVVADVISHIEFREI